MTPSTKGSRTTWRVAPCVEKGLAHETQGDDCQDSARVSLASKRLIIAVSDGAGSAPQSRQGAIWTTTRAIFHLIPIVATLNPENWDQILRKVLAATRKDILTLADLRESEPGDFAATCLVVVIDPFFSLVAHVGDGGCVVRTERGEYLPLAIPYHEGAANRTSFLVDPDWEEHLRTHGILARIDAVAAFTDGLENECLERARTPHVPFFKPIFEFLKNAPVKESRRALKDLIRSDQIRERTCDDCTLVLGVLKEVAR